MNVIAKISCYLERSVVTLKLRKEYLNTVTCDISVVLWIKNWTVWYIERYCVSTYTGVTNCQKTGRFLANPVYRRLAQQRMTLSDLEMAVSQFVSTVCLKPVTCHTFFWNYYSILFVRCPAVDRYGLYQYYRLHLSLCVFKPSQVKYGKTNSSGWALHNSWRELRAVSVNCDYCALYAALCWAKTNPRSYNQPLGLLQCSSSIYAHFSQFSMQLDT